MGFLAFTERRGGACETKVSRTEWWDSRGPGIWKVDVIKHAGSAKYVLANIVARIQNTRNKETSR